MLVPNFNLRRKSREMLLKKVPLFKVNIGDIVIINPLFLGNLGGTVYKRIYTCRYYFGWLVGWFGLTATRQSKSNVPEMRDRQN